MEWLHAKLKNLSSNQKARLHSLVGLIAEGFRVHIKPSGQAREFYTICKSAGLTNRQVAQFLTLCLDARSVPVLVKTDVSSEANLLTVAKKSNI